MATAFPSPTRGVSRLCVAGLVLLAVFLGQERHGASAWGFQVRQHGRRQYGRPRSSVSFQRSEFHGAGSTCGSFVLPSGSIRGRGARSGLNMIFERMSEECIGALVTAQKESARLGQSMVDREIMTVGVVDHPQNARSTLQRKGITLRKVKRTVEDMYAEWAARSESKNDAAAGGDSMGQLFSMNRKARDVELPFAPPLKKALSGAAKLADKMGSITINSEHLLLALLDYNAEQKSAAVVDDEGLSYGTLAVLMRLETDRANDFSAAGFCQDLVQDMRDVQLLAGEAELVTGSSSSTAKTPTLQEVGVDLTAMAAQGKLDVVYGRDKEIQSCLRTLIRRRKNNPCLVGEPGVGKTAIAEGLAQLFAAPGMLQQALETGDFKDKDELQRLRALAQACPARLRGHRIVQVELANLVAGTKYRGEFEERVQALVEEVTDERAPPTILFLDEIHTLVGAGSAEGGMDAANILKPALARGTLQVLGATTIAEYRKNVEKDAALERRLQPIFVKEPSVAETVGVLEALADRYGSHHGVSYTPEALQMAAKLSERYIQDRFLPDKAIDLMDEAGAIVHLQQAADNKSLVVVTEDDIAQVVSEWSNVPVGQLTAEETSRLLELETVLGAQVKGQDRAVQAVARAVRRAKSGLRDVSRPIASFLFCGPTGVGKTHLCKTLARTYFGSEKDLIRLDMSEYMDKYTVSRLTGPPPGYVGYDEGGQLTEAVRRAPFSVILLDELEKAHGDVLNILLQILEDGVLTDGKGRTCNFKNTILVMTSNVASSRILDIWKQRGGGGGTTFASPTAAATQDGMVDDGDGGGGGGMQPLSPNQVLSRLQNNPAAMSLMMEAASDPDMRKAMQTALSGSPADLLQLGRGNSKVADFLQRLWACLTSQNPSSTPPSSGLEAVRQGMQQPLSAAGEEEQGNFVSGVVQQFQEIMPTATRTTTRETKDDSNAKQEEEEKSDVKKLYSEMSQVVKQELEKTMRPEFLNRLDNVIVFSPLGPQELRSIAQLLMTRAMNRATTERDICLQASSTALLEQVVGGANSQFGARPMRRRVQRLVEDSVSEALLRGFLQSGDEAELDWNKDEGSVQVTRLRDGKSFLMVVENDDDDYGMGAGGDFGKSQTVGTKDEPMVNPSNGRS